MPGLSPYVRTLAAAGSTGDRDTINVRGSTVFIRSLDQGEISVTAQGFRSNDKHTVYMSQADKLFTVDDYGEIFIQNLQAVAVTVIMYLGEGDFSQPVPDIVNVSVNKPSSNTAYTIADNTITTAEELFDPADYPGFVEAWITALPANDQNLRLGDSNVTSTRGLPLQAGDTALWKSTEPPYAVEAASGTNAVAVVIFTEE